MKQRVARTSTGKRLASRVKSITPAKKQRLTPSQISYRKRKAKVENYYKHEAKLARYRPR